MFFFPTSTEACGKAVLATFTTYYVSVMLIHSRINFQHLFPVSHSQEKRNQLNSVHTQVQLNTVILLSTVLEQNCMRTFQFCL